jgi:hypothetical protein
MKLKIIKIKRIIIMKTKSFLTLLVTVSLLQTYSTVGAELTEKAVSEQAYSSLMGLMDPVVSKKDFFQYGFTPASQNRWLNAIDNLAAYAKSQFKSISTANSTLFTNSIEELRSSTKDLFATVNNFVAMGQNAIPSTLAAQMNQLGKHRATIDTLLNSLKQTKWSDYEITVKSKAMFAKILGDWDQLLVKTHAKMHAYVAATETSQTKEKAKLAQLENELKAIAITNTTTIKHAEKKMRDSQPEQAMSTLGNLLESIKGIINVANPTRKDYLTALKELLILKQLYAKLPKNIQSENTVKEIEISLTQALENL